MNKSVGFFCLLAATLGAALVSAWFMRDLNERVRKLEAKVQPKLVELEVIELRGDRKCRCDGVLFRDGGNDCGCSFGGICSCD